MNLILRSFGVVVASEREGEKIVNAIEEALKKFSEDWEFRYEYED